MDCRRYKSALSDAAAGPLDAERQRVLDEHLSRCAACAARIERLKRAMIAIDRSLAESSEAEPSAKFLAFVGTRRNVPLPADARHSPAYVSARTLAVAAAVLIVAAAAWLLRAQLAGPVISPGRAAPPSVAATVPIEPPSKVEKLAPRALSARAEPSFAAATSVRGRIARRGAVAPNRPFFERVKVAPGERTAVFQLYALLQSGKVKPESLFPPSRDLDKPLKIAPLQIEPISIPPLEINRISDASHDPSPDAGSTHSPRTDRNEETTP